MKCHVSTYAIAATGVALTLATVVIPGSRANDSLANNETRNSTTAPDAPGNTVDLTSAFSQTLICFAGIKPYIDSTGPTLWTVSFDGDQLSITNGRQINSGRFSTSGHSIQRNNSDTGAKLETHTGSGGGRLWFERGLSGELISAGIIHRTGADRVECGRQYASEWLNERPIKPFGREDNRLVWQSAAGIALNCIRYAGTDFGAPGTEAPVAAQLHLIQNGSMSVTLNGEPEAAMSVSQAGSAQRTESFVHETVRDGGQRVWLSRQEGDGDTDSVRLRLRFNYSLLDIHYQRADGRNLRCVPAPLDPRRLVES